MNLLNLQSSSNASSLKLLLSGTTTFVTPAGNNVSNSATIAHGYGSDVLLPQVSMKDGSTAVIYTTPFYSGDSRYSLYAELDSTNLYIYAVLTSAGGPYPAITWTCNYRILIP